MIKKSGFRKICPNIVKSNLDLKILSQKFHLNINLDLDLSYNIFGSSLYASGATVKKTLHAVVQHVAIVLTDGK